MIGFWIYFEGRTNYRTCDRLVVRSEREEHGYPQASVSKAFLRAGNPALLSQPPASQVDAWPLLPTALRMPTPGAVQQGACCSEADLGGSGFNLDLLSLRYQLYIRVENEPRQRRYVNGDIY